MDLGKWCLEFGIKKKYEVADAVELIKAYESTYVPVYGRALPSETRTCETCAYFNLGVKSEPCKSCCMTSWWTPKEPRDA